MNKHINRALALLVLFICALFWVFRLSAAPTTNSPAVTLAWDPVANTSVSGYRLYYGPSPLNYTNFVGVAGRTNVTCVVSNLVRGSTYYFAVTSYIATNGLESLYSEEISYMPVPLPPLPTNFSLTVLKP